MPTTPINFMRKSSLTISLRNKSAVLKKSGYVNNIFSNQKISLKNNNCINVLKLKVNQNKKYLNTKSYCQIPLLSNLKRHLPAEIVRQTKSNHYGVIFKNNSKQIKNILQKKNSVSLKKKFETKLSFDNRQLQAVSQPKNPQIQYLQSYPFEYQNYKTEQTDKKCVELLKNAQLRRTYQNTDIEFRKSSKTQHLLVKKVQFQKVSDFKVKGSSIIRVSDLLHERAQTSNSNMKREKYKSLSNIGLYNTEINLQQRRQKILKRRQSSIITQKETLNAQRVIINNQP